MKFKTLFEKIDSSLKGLYIKSQKILLALLNIRQTIKSMITEIQNLLHLKMQWLFPSMEKSIH